MFCGGEVYKLIELATVRHTEQLETPTLGIAFSADAAYMRPLVMSSETSSHALYGHFRRDSFWDGLGGLRCDV